MSITHRQTPTWGAGATLLGRAVDTTADTEQNVSVSIPNNTTDQALGVDWAADKLKSLYIIASRDCTLEVNSGSAPTDTISLTANVALNWLKSAGGREPFAGTAGAVTNMYVTVPDVSGGAACEFELRAAVDL